MKTTPLHEPGTAASLPPRAFGDKDATVPVAPVTGGPLQFGGTIGQRAFLACLLSALVLAGTTTHAATPLRESTFTEIVRDVNVVAAATKATEPARTNVVVHAPDLVRTGPESRAELTAPDQTITRVGANTVFSFENAGRTINLNQGSLLFHAPAGRGGGTIKSGGASAAVLGTTIMVVVSPTGGFKVIVLEGSGRVKLAGGRSVRVGAGQMVMVINDGKGFSPVSDIDLGRLVEGALLVSGFSHPLASLPKIQAALAQQNKLRARGRPAGGPSKPVGGVDEIEMATAVGGGTRFGQQGLGAPGSGQNGPPNP